MDTSNIHSDMGILASDHYYLCCFNDVIKLGCSRNILNAEKSVGDHVKKSVISSFFYRIMFYLAVRCRRFL